MKREKIEIDNFNSNTFSLFNKDWMLLTAGNFKENKFNTMTISWGFFGTFWFKPIVIVGVRPQRHTFDFMEKGEEFTISSFNSELKDKLMFCGKNSGKDVDKIKETNLTPIKSENISSPGFDEAELIIECKLIYSDLLDKESFLENIIPDEVYANGDFHKLYFAEVQNISGISKYQK